MHEARNCVAPAGQQLKRYANAWATERDRAGVRRYVRGPIPSASACGIVHICILWRSTAEIEYDAPRRLRPHIRHPIPESTVRAHDALPQLARGERTLPV